MKAFIYIALIAGFAFAFYFLVIRKTEKDQPKKTQPEEKERASGKRGQRGRIRMPAGASVTTTAPQLTENQELLSQYFNRTQGPQPADKLSQYFTMGTGIAGPNMQ